MENEVSWITASDIVYINRQAADLFLCWSEYYHEKVKARDYFNRRSEVTAEIMHQYGRDGYNIFMSTYNKLIQDEIRLIKLGNKE